ncbi:MAG: M18 family aminopeptidase [Actinomycetota bacterium]
MNPRALDDLIAFLDDSPSPWHAVQSVRARLDGYSTLDETAAWSTVPERGLVVRGGALIAWHIPSGLAPSAPLHIVGAHTDSPCLRVKPHPDAGVGGWRQLAVETYGGILNNTWLDRDLAVAGIVLDADGAPILFDSHAPIARVPQLAVHLDRGVNTDGLKLDTQRHLLPVWSIAPDGPDDFAEWLAASAGLDTSPTWWELCLYEAQGAAVIGADRSMLASGRLDNLLSCWAAATALSSATPNGHGAVIVLNDHEEVGSASTSGAAGPFLDTVLRRLVAGRGGAADDLARSFAGSACISADNAHALHPNYVDRHEPGHQPMFNAGPVIKVNANQRYATSAATAERFQRACDTAGVPWQVFVSRNNMPCGSTIGPLTATRLGIATADVGVAQLSMHSARELCGVDDPPALSAALTAFLEQR